MNQDRDQALREHVLYLLKGGGAHAKFDEVIVGFPAKLRGKRPAELPYSAWELLEHMRLAQWDILQFSRDARHVSPQFPQGYWPKSAKPGAGAWEKSVRSFRADAKAMQELVADPEIDLYERIPWGEGQTVLREALLVADHNAYHLGQLVMVRRLLGAWKGD